MNAYLQFVNIFYGVVTYYTPMLALMLWMFPERTLKGVKSPSFLVDVSGFTMFGVLILDATSHTFGSHVWVQMLNSYFDLTWIPLFSVYGFLGLLFVEDLQFDGWGLVRAFCVSVFAVWLGSYLWEAPIIIRNAALTGYEPDWWAHLVGVGWLLVSTVLIGWNRRRVFLLIPAILVGVWASTWDASGGWNQAPFMAARIICTVIVYLMMNRSEKK